MSNISLSLQINEESKVIKLLIEDRHPFDISIVDKSIDIDKLYEWLDIKVENTLFIDPSCKSVESPTSEQERIYNNVLYFVETLINSVNLQLKQIRDDQENEKQLGVNVEPATM